MTERILTEVQRDRVRLTPQPIPPFPLTTTVQTVFETGDNEDFQINSLWAASLGTGTKDISVYFVPAGDVASGANAIAVNLDVPANGRVALAGGDFPTLRIGPNVAIMAQASANDTINIGGWGDISTGGQP